jgi:hypothetical protein
LEVPLKKINRPDNRPANDRIELRAVPYKGYSGKLEERIEAVINGIELSSSIEQEDDRTVSPLSRDELGQGFRLWGPDGVAPYRHYAKDGWVAVLTCSCDNFGCGGASARITFNADTVVWSDFRDACHHQEIRVGPFAFARQEYEAALAKLT